MLGLPKQDDCIRTKVYKSLPLKSVREGLASTSALKVRYVKGYDRHPGHSNSNHDLDKLDCFKIVVYLYSHLL